MKWPFFSFTKKVRRKSRKFQRAKIPLLIRYQVSGEPEEFVSNLKDLAAGGIRFTAMNEIQLNKRIRIKIKLPWREEPFRAWAKVTRCAKLKQSPVFRVAAQFVGVEREDLVELESFIDAIVRDQKSARKKTSRQPGL